MSDNDVIDQAVLDGLLDTIGGDREFLTELMGAFFEDNLRQLAVMRQALESGEAEALRRAAHSVKSNSATFGASKLYALCKELEDMGKQGSFDGADVLTDAIEGECILVQEALITYS